MQVLGRVKNALIVMDEAGILLDGLQMYNMPYEIFYELRQHRKDGVDLLLSAQSILDIAYPFRRLIQFEHRIIMKLGKFVQVATKDPQPAGQTFGKHIWLLNDWVFKIYRTEFKVKPPEYFDMSAIDQEDMPVPLNLRYEQEQDFMRSFYENNKGLFVPQPLNGYDPSRRAWA
jgi:hypothetical protein